MSRNIELGTCQHCVFGETAPFERKGYLSCRRWAPAPLGRQLVAVTDEGYETHKCAEWPLVRHTDWCGEFIHCESDEISDSSI